MFSVMTLSPPILFLWPWCSLSWHSTHLSILCDHDVLCHDTQSTCPTSVTMMFCHDTQPTCPSSVTMMFSVMALNPPVHLLWPWCSLSWNSTHLSFLCDDDVLCHDTQLTCPFSVTMMFSVMTLNSPVHPLWPWCSLGVCHQSPAQRWPRSNQHTTGWMRLWLLHICYIANNWSPKTFLTLKSHNTEVKPWQLLCRQEETWNEINTPWQVI